MAKIKEKICTGGVRGELKMCGSKSVQIMTSLEGDFIWGCDNKKCILYKGRIKEIVKESMRKRKSEILN